MQNLFHLYRLRESDVIVLDEPDVYLHADLQRRLTQVAGSFDAQVVVATHSTEVVAEAGTSAIVWMDRTRTRAYRAPDDESLDLLAGQLGSQFNLRLAKVLRARHTLFVEGGDAGFLKDVARLIGATAFANEVHLAIVPIEGWNNQFRAEAFGWVNDKLLKGSMSATILLDRDYHADTYVDDLRAHFERSRLACHIWMRKEIESYFLHAGAMARAGTATQEAMTRLLASTTEEMYEHILFQFVAAAKQDNPGERHLADATIGERFVPWLRELWSNPTDRLYRCPAKDVLSAVNRDLAAAGHRTLTFTGIIRQLQAHEVPEEMVDLIRSINRRLLRNR
jgi:energy-coupling factor transporter ATP-binding protein EcfA2